MVVELRAARSAIRMQAQEPAFSASKLATTSYYFTYVFPEVQQLLGLSTHACVMTASMTRFHPI